MSEAARVTGVRERQVYRWKAGTSVPSPEALAALEKEGLI